MLAPVRIAAPAVTPVSLVEAKAHLRVDHEDDDAVITALIGAATDHLDGRTGILGRALVDQTWRQDFNGFRGCLRLPLAPVAADGVESVKYFDANNVEQTLAATTYHLLVDALGPFVSLKAGQSWPSTFARLDAVSIEFVAGYGDDAKVPDALRVAILMHVAHIYNNPEAVVVGGAATSLPLGHGALIAPYRRISV